MAGGLAMTKITGISCTHVKGIEHLDIKCEFYPNKPNFLVAPNGSGKSSLVTAFASLNSQRLKLSDPDRYNGEDWDDSSVSLTFEDGAPYCANLDSNEIMKEIDVQVIRSGLYANMTNHRAGPRVLSQTKMSVQQCVLYEKVPKAVRLGYSVAKERAKYPANVRPMMGNLKELFASREFLLELLGCDLALNKTTGGRYAAAINSFFKSICLPVSNADRSKDDTTAVAAISTVKPLAAIKGVLESWRPDAGDVKNYLDAIQVNRFIEGRRSDLREACAYMRYSDVKREASDMLLSLNRTRIPVKAHVDRGSLVVDFPDWDDASNGEIDVLQLCAALFRARARLGDKEKSLLMVDEVFDYLDDANLLVAQHFLLEMMSRFKKSGKSLYVVILTHLDPSLFKSFRFKDLHVSYIEAAEGPVKPGPLAKLLGDRRRCQKELNDIYETVSSHYLHFSTEGAASGDVLAYVMGQGIGSELSQPLAFRNRMEGKLVDYLADNPVSPPEVCCGIRIVVERLCYEGLSTTEEKGEYLRIDKGTEVRLDYAEAHGVNVPESFHLLGSIYNSCMHLTGKSGELELVRRQLDNKIVRHMIEASLKELGWAAARV